MNRQPIYQFHEPTYIDVAPLETKKILWIFDIDETLLRFEEKTGEFHPFSQNLDTWLRKIIQSNHAICLLTARYPPHSHMIDDREKDVFSTLNLSPVTDQYYTLHRSIPFFSYTSGALKGPYAKEIISKYLEKEKFDAIFFLDDRLTQIDDVLHHCSHLHPFLYGIWISKMSQEGHLSNKYQIVPTI